ncbi:zinc finger protein 292a [Triplophysa dalaica]|uniref:zinc finger protein 292a n=1 Tax=Triplophysa dalaica TaxID=1582913 RepID=UPI0024E02CE1|nr:zinc finger protein 292a [Triplophysa dalaica]
MAEEEDSGAEAVALRHRFQDLISEFKRSSQSPLDASNSFCQDFCKVLMNQVHQRKQDEDSLSLLKMYTVSIECFAEASPFLCPECEHFTDVLDKLSWSCLNLLLSFTEHIPGALWEELQTSVTVAHGILQGHGNSQLHTLLTLVEESGVWTNITLCSLLSNNMPDVEKVHEILTREGPELLHMRIKHLIKQKLVDKAARLAKTCAEFPEFGGKKNFKQIYLVCLCEIYSQQELMQEIKDVDCKDALDMICNLESEEDEKGALGLCTAFFKRQLLSGDVYCAWELTLFWSKLLIRLESKQAFLEQCRLLAQLSGSVYHILLLIKVVQAEADKEGLSVCIEMCIQALKMGVHDNEDCNVTICKTISCLLPLDIEVKRACQLTEFLIKPSVDSFYSVETVFNEPDQKLEEEDPSIINSLRCDLLLALKTKWPFDPEFWDWKTLKRHCISLMDQEAAAVLSADKLSDSEDNDAQDPNEKYFKDLTQSLTHEPSEVETERKKKREMKKLKEKGFVSARFRNWQAYMQYCVLCDKEFLGHRIVKHALKHVQDGIFRCPICAETFQTREVLEPHVALHVRQSCKERLAAMNATKKCPSLDTKVGPVSSTLNQQKDLSKTAVQVSKETPLCSNNLYASNSIPSLNGNANIRLLSPRQCSPIGDVNNTNDFSCPVASCQKGFKYFKYLVAHVKGHKNEQEAICFLETKSQKAMCQYCHRQFVNLTHLNDHLQMHCGEKPYYCIQLGCNCSFSSHDELVIHRKVHAEFQAQCTYPNCERIFNETYLLYDHEAQHYTTFSCRRHNCGMVFHTLSELDMHQQEHAMQLDVHQQEHAKQDHLSIDEGLHSQKKSPSPCNIQEVSQEPSLVKIEFSVSRTLNTTQDSTGHTEHLVTCPALSESETASQTSAIQPDGSDACRSLQSVIESTDQLRLESCYVKLEPITIKDDPILGNALKNSDSLTQALLKDKKLFCCPSSQLKHSAVKEAKTEKSLSHICPFETCTRRYSTSKSLSRHVKKVHPEAFEEWKLSNKYKRIADHAARKALSEHTTTCSQTMKKWKSHSRQICQHGEGIKQTCLDSTHPDSTGILSCHESMPHVNLKLSSQLEGTHDSASPNPSELTQLPLLETWATPTTDNLDSGFYVENNYSPMTSSDNQQTNPLYHSEAILDYASPSVYDGIIPLSLNVHTPSSVMNEASKYVSSSLRVLHALNGDQTFDLSQVESASLDVGYSQNGQNHPSGISVNASLLQTASLPEQNVSPNFLSFSSSASVSEQSLGEICTDGLSDIKCLSNLAPNFKEQSENVSLSVDSAVSEVDKQHPEDFCNPELSQKGTEGPQSDEQIDLRSVEAKQAKKIKSSKRTKWPAIIQDGKVICCRCYREFSSTKSLGGHLSKRSQCKPVDEIDLTADLPTSFLDFLNDPDISTVQMALSTNSTHDQNLESFVYPPVESDDFIDNSSTSMEGANYNIQNSNAPSQEPSEVSGNSTFCLQTMQETAVETKPESEITLANTADEDTNIVEIERALERLDLVDMLNVGALVPESTDLHNQCSKPETKSELKLPIENEMDIDPSLNLKPFRCTEDCMYGAMTKEALFKHLCRVHDYSEERINEMKKNPDKFAPYNCHLCSKTFTRTTGLKIHYKNVHHFSKEEICQLKIGCDWRKIRQSKKEKKKECKDTHVSPITKADNDLSGQHPDQVNPKLTMKSLDSTVKTEAVSVKTKAVNVKTKAVSVKTKAVNVKTKAVNVKTKAVSVKTKAVSVKTKAVSVKTKAVSVKTKAVSVKTKTASVATEKYKSPMQDPLAGFSSKSVEWSQASNIKILDGHSAPKNINKLQGTLLTPESHEPYEPGVFAEHKLSEESPLPCGTTNAPAKGTESITPQSNRTVETESAEMVELQDKSNMPMVNIDSADTLTLYRPYRCVHEGCVAAFSIQQNLILHYRAMHQSEREEKTGPSTNDTDGSVLVQEYKCQVKQCSKVVTKVTSLLKHYLLLHKCTLEKTSALLSGVEVGTFQCDQSKCPAHFTCHLKYIDHIKNDHKAIKVSAEGDFESVDLTFKCQFQGCDRVYTTKSNLLRHVMKKHHATFETMKEKLDNGNAGDVQTKKISGSTDPNHGKENIANNTKVKKKKKNLKKQEDIAQNWITFGKPVLKSTEEAFAMCNKGFPVQYPCMLKSCDSVLSAEPTILKHYTAHGLTERFIEDQRSQFIFCKKSKEIKMAETVPEDQTDNSKGSSQITGPEVQTSTNSVTVGKSCVTATAGIKRKRGRPRKSECKKRICVDRKLSLRNCSGDGVKCMLKVSGSILNPSNHQDNYVGNEVALKLYGPSEYETSTLKFNEDSRIPAKQKKDYWTSQQTLKPVTQERDEVQCIVNFRNPLRLETVNNVKIVVYENMSTSSDLLKQLQDMQPIVILNKWLHS